MKHFPFVAKLNERVLCNVNGQWVQAVVVDRSTSARRMYKPTNWETGELGPWRTAQSAVVGYEVVTEDQVHHYANTQQIRAIKKLEKPAEMPRRRAYEQPTATNDLVFGRLYE
jgi:hypothetical protein